MTLISILAAIKVLGDRQAPKYLIVYPALSAETAAALEELGYDCPTPSLIEWS